MLAVVDTGPLYAVVDEDDADHARCRTVLESAEYRLIIPTMIVAEATYLIGTRLGSDVEASDLTDGKDGPGGFGWLSWDGSNSANALSDSICEPSNPPFSLDSPFDSQGAYGGVIGTIIQNSQTARPMTTRTAVTTNAAIFARSVFIRAAPHIPRAP